MSTISRPSSAASHRPLSRVSNRSHSRPQSRHSHHPSTRLSSRISSQCLKLVTQITGLTPAEDDDFGSALDILSKRIDAVGKQGESIDMRTALNHLCRFAKKARIQSHDELAEAFEICSDRFLTESERRKDLDDEVSWSKLPDHLQFLLALSSPPSASTLVYAADVIDQSQNPRRPTPGLTWAGILAEEPFEGQHWEGAFGYPPGSIVDQNEPEENPAFISPPSSASVSEEDTRSETSSAFDFSNTTQSSGRVLTPPPSYLRSNDYSSNEERITASLILREELETLHRRQYWKQDSRVVSKISTEFRLGNPSSLGPAFDRVTNQVGEFSFADLSSKKYIHEHDSVREILLALQGRANLVLCEVTSEREIPEHSVSPDTPALLHLTPAAQTSIYSSFARLSTLLHHLRLFSSSVLSASYQTAGRPSPCLTIEAFAEALHSHLTCFDAWLSQREERMLRAHLQKGKGTVVSLLSLEKEIRDEFSGSFEELVRIVNMTFPGSAWLSSDQIIARVRQSPSKFSSHLLDSLFSMIQSRHSFGDRITASILLQIFLKTAEPTWQMLGRWLKDGTFMSEIKGVASDHAALPTEFFIESNDIPFIDPDFWVEGYRLRTEPLDESISTRNARVPAFLRPLADNILSAGKSIGLLRILEYNTGLDFGNTFLSATSWPTFQSFISSAEANVSVQQVSSTSMENSSRISIYSADILSLVLSDHLLPVCASAGKALHEVLLMGCDFMHHLCAFEDLYLLRRADAMSDFCDILFNAIDSKKVWTDFHFLNTAFRDASSPPKGSWIDSTLVRMSYKSDRNSAQSRSIRTLNSITMNYSPPFPLPYIFDEHVIHKYNTIFILLLQIRRAKFCLDNILLRASAAKILRSHDELKVFYATRGRLSWFVNTFLAFLCSHAIQVGIERFHEALRSVCSLDDLLNAHKVHLQGLWTLCLLDEKMTSIHRAVLSILDMSISFSDQFTAFAGDTTLNTSRISESKARRHRSRRFRRENRNIVSYDQIPSFLQDDSGSSESELDESVIPQEQDGMLSFEGQSANQSFADDFFGQNDKMTKDLDKLVRYIRKEVERSALSEGLQAFDILAFSLQDWDL